MKKLFLLIFALFLFVNYNYSQLTATIGSLTTAKKGDNVVVPINVTGFNNLGALGIWIPIDPAKFTYDTLTANAKLLTSAGSFGSNYDMNDPDGPKLKIFWTSAGSAAINIGTDKFCDLKLKLLVDGAKLCFDELGSNVSNLDGVEYTVAYTCGTIGSDVFVKNITPVSTLFETYPNPSSGTVNFLYNGKSNLKQISVYNINGEMVYNSEINTIQNLYTLNLSDLRKGMYVLRALSNEGVIFNKIIIQ